MISFLLDEGAITVTTLTGIFTALLLASFKNNIVDPVVETVVPLNKLHDLLDDGKINNSISKSTTPESNNVNQNSATQNNFAMLGNQFGGYGKTKIKFKIFLRDFITWLIIMYIIYLLWKKFVHPIKMKKGLIAPDVATHILPMGIGKNK
jgi:hypothetical protein